MTLPKKHEIGDDICRYSISTLYLGGDTSIDETGIYDPVSGTYTPDSMKHGPEHCICKRCLKKP